MSGTHITPLVLGWTLSDLRVRAEQDASGIQFCSQTVCYRPEVEELAKFVLALIDLIEADQ